MKENYQSALTLEYIKKHNDIVSEWVPSQVTKRAWVSWFNPEKTIKNKNKSLPFSGKWCIFGNAFVLDRVWKKLKKVVESNPEIMSAKIRTSSVDMRKMMMEGNFDVKAQEDRNKTDNSKRVICVYVEDYRDKDNVYKVRDLIRELGVKSIIKFKTDEATIKGIYTGDEREFLYVDKLRKNNA